MFSTGENVGPATQQQGWSAMGTLKTYNDDREVSLQQQFDKVDTYTVTFQRTLGPSNADFAAGPECEALISFTVAGNTITRRVDVINGMSIQGIAGSILVVCKDKTSTGAVGEYNVTITVAPGTRAPNQIQPFLKAGFRAGNPATVLPASSFDFDVPIDAGVNSVLVLVARPIVAGAASPIPEQACQVLHIAPGAIPVLAQYDPRSQSWVPLAPGAKTIRVYNADTDDVIFTVYYGIDG